MITLYSTGPVFGLPDASPFGIKTILLLKLAAIPFKVERADIRKAPRGKVPWIADGDLLVSDSRFIKAHLEVQHGADFSGSYSARDLACGLSVERMLENQLYWFILENRWLDPQNFAKGPAILFNDAPWLIRPFIVQMVLGKLRRDVRAQGHDRLSMIEKRQLVSQVLDAIRTIMADNPFFLGHRISGTDATIFGFLAALEAPIFTSEYADISRTYPSLMAYLDRIRTTYFQQS